MNNPIRTTVVYALASGLVVVPAAMLISPYITWSTAIKLTLWVDIALYAVLIARWGDTRLLPVLFPLATLLGTALWPGVYAGFFIFALGVFSWVRSGICFQGSPIRAMAAEVITMVGAVTLLLFIGGRTPAAMALDICLFFLVQSLYFFWVPLRRSRHDRGGHTDVFEQAAEQANKILDGI